MHTKITDPVKWHTHMNQPMKSHMHTCTQTGTSHPMHSGNIAEVHNEPHRFSHCEGLQHRWQTCASLTHIVVKVLHSCYLSIFVLWTSDFKWINQLDATISPVYYLTFIYNSTCFGRPHAHHQELNNCSSSLWFYLQSVVIAMLLVVVRPSARPQLTALLSPCSEGKTRGCYCSCWAPDDGREDAQNMLSCK